MSVATQQAAKAKSQQYLDRSKKSLPGGKATDDLSRVLDVFNKFGAQTNQRFDQLYQQQLKDSRQTAERAAEIQSQYQQRDISGMNTRAGIQARAQVQSTALSSAANNYNARTNRIGAMNSVSPTAGAEFAKSLLSPYYTPNLQKIDQANFDSKVKELNEDAFGSNKSGGRSGGRSGGSYTTAYGMNAPPPSPTRMGDPYGKTFAVDNSRAIRDWQSNQDRVAFNNAQMSKAAVAGDIALEKARVGTQKHLISAQTNSQAYLAGQQNRFTEQESRKERMAREKLANIDANARIQSSLFSSVSSNPYNYQYWGGKV